MLEPTSPLRHESPGTQDGEFLHPALQAALGEYVKQGDDLSPAEAQKVVALLAPALQVLGLAAVRLLESSPAAHDELARLLPEDARGRLTADDLLEFLLDVEAAPGERAARLEGLLRAPR